MKGLITLAVFAGIAWFFFGEELGLRQTAETTQKKGQAAIMQMHEKAEEQEKQSQY